MVVAHHLEVHQGNLVGGGLQLLEAEHIGLVVADPLQQAFVDGCADAVHIITDDFHSSYLSKCRRFDRLNDLGFCRSLSLSKGRMIILNCENSEKVISFFFARYFFLF